MLIYKTGDILEAKENIICHQVNSQGIMGAGLALQIAKKYPKCEKAYQYFCKEQDYDYEILKSQICEVLINDKHIFNCFTQKLNFDTDYIALEKCFNEVMIICKNHNLTVAVPYKYGSNIANGDWKEVESIFEKLSNKHGIDINIYKLEEEIK